jgi:hypothetical protein
MNFQNLLHNFHLKTIILAKSLFIFYSKREETIETLTAQDKSKAEAAKS